MSMSYTQYDLVWKPSTLDALLDTSPRSVSTRTYPLHLPILLLVFSYTNYQF